MATILRRGDRYRAQIRRQGYPTVSKTFRKRIDAVRWARQVEARMEVSQWETNEQQSLSLTDALGRYWSGHLSKLRGGNCERSRVRSLTTRLGSLRLEEITSATLASYRDERLQTVGPQTVVHELRLLRRLLKVASTEWGVKILPTGIPQVRMPRLPAGRERVIDVGELARLCFHLSNITALLVRFAIETCMRRGELVQMKWQHVNFERSLLRIPTTKTDVPRTIPLSTAAVEILRTLPYQDGLVWKMSGDWVSSQFKKACRLAGLEDVRFHDLRHTGLTRLAERGWNPLELSVVSGHRSLSMLKRYSHIRPETLLEKLG